MPRVAMLLASLALVLTTLTWTGSVTTVAAQDGGYSPDDQEMAFFDLLNQYRGSLGLAPVSLNAELGAAAKYHSYDMATENYFSHYALDGTDPVTNINNFGYYGTPSSENILGGMEYAQDVLAGWQGSPEHNATMTNPQFTEVGVGRYYDPNSQYGWYWTAEYGGGSAPPPQELVAAPVVTDAGTAAPVPVDAAPVDASVPVETAAPAPDDGTLIGQPGTETVIDDSSKGHRHRDKNGNTDGMTTTVQEPPTVTTDNGTVELGQDAVNADGDRAVSTGANPVANGEGDTVIYGDINTGGIQGETIVYEPPSYTVNGETTTMGPPPSSNTNTTTTYAPPPPPASEPVTTDPTLTETTTTNISMEDGTGRAMG
jgi:uncharacterized protein YkwD